MRSARAHDTQRRAEGRLTWILPKAGVEEPGLFLYFARGASAMPKLRDFVDVAREVLNIA